MRKLYGQTPQPRHRDVIFGEARLRIDDAVDQPSLHSKSDGLVQAARVRVAFLHDELNAENVRTILVNFVQQRLEQSPSDASTLSIRIYDDGKCGEHMCKPTHAIRIRVQFTNDRTSHGVFGHNNDAVSETASHELVDVFLGDLIRVARDATGPRGHGDVQRANRGEIGVRCGANGYRGLRQGVLAVVTRRSELRRFMVRARVAGWSAVIEFVNSNCIHADFADTAETAGFAPRAGQRSALSAVLLLEKEPLCISDIDVQGRGEVSA